ncbi:hypothetical protein [Chakrabartyella piscis]|uniref:hypothetical protein n=1 Tax=Chakrabartyella piscis TaxID=2918914 RepID=UPI0029589D4A|nr:hypothetical protein [Chakrabartyella piscis]
MFYIEGDSVYYQSERMIRPVLYGKTSFVAEIELGTFLVQDFNLEEGKYEPTTNETYEYEGITYDLVDGMFTIEIEPTEPETTYTQSEINEAVITLAEVL